MITCHRFVGGAFVGIDAPEAGCWVNVVAPDEDERRRLGEEFGIVAEFLRAALDAEESAHVDIDDDEGQRMVIVDCPVVDEEAARASSSCEVHYATQPLAVIYLEGRDVFLTVSLVPNAVVDELLQGRGRPLTSAAPAHLLLHLLYKIARLYPSYLNTIVRQYGRIEARLRASMKNAELIGLLDIQKSLVYFSTSLTSDRAVLERIASGKVTQLDDDDRDLLDDVAVELSQASETCAVYMGILEATMEAFGNVISNNLNAAMKVLAIITLVLAVPTIVFGFWGMNTPLPLDFSWLAPLAVALVLGAIVALVCIRGRIFK